MPNKTSLGKKKKKSAFIGRSGRYIYSLFSVAQNPATAVLILLFRPAHVFRLFQYRRDGFIHHEFDVAVIITPFLE